MDQATNRIGVPAGQSGAMGYDAAGNLTQDSYTGAGWRNYDAENRMVSATANNYAVSRYVYDSAGKRARRFDGGTEVWHVYGLGGELLAEYAAGSVTPQKEYGYRSGELLITATSGTTSSGVVPVTWTNAVGVAATTGALQKTAVTGWGNAGAISQQSITSGDGYMEFTASDASTYRMCGLGHGDDNQNYIDIDYAFYVTNNGTLAVYESGNYAAYVGTYAAGDRFRVAVEGGVVKYRRNGVLVYTSTVVNP